MQAEEIIKALSGVCHRYGDEVVFAYLFGSTALDKAGAMSDVDVAVYLKGGLGRRSWRRSSASMPTSPGP